MNTTNTNNDTRKRINILKDIIRQPYAWPGGYEKIAIMDDGGLICHKCCKEEYYNILHSTKFDYIDGWNMQGVCLDIDIEDPVCDHCNHFI